MEKRLLTLRRKLKKKKPEFLRQEYHTHGKRLGRKWRQPKGRTSKLRMKEKARGSHPGVGYSSPSAVRGLSKFGYVIVRVSNVHELSKITNHKAEMAELAAGVGAKKKLEIINAAKQRGIKIFNLPKKSLEKKKKVVSEKTEKPKEHKPHQAK
jgi:large subunit ribosomal protein L32e